MPPDSYIQAAVAQMKLDFDLPDIFYLDLWPFGPCVIECSGPDAAAIPTTANSFPQSDLVTQFFVGNVGPNFVEAANGPLWKELHRMLAPGLTPGAVKTYYDFIADEATILHRRLRQLADSGDVIDLHVELGKYTFEVVGRIFFGESLDTQRAHSQLFDDMKHVSDLVGTRANFKNPVARWLASREKYRRLWRMKRDVEARVRNRFLALQQQKVLPTRTNATNLLDRMLVGQVQSGRPIDSRLMAVIVEKWVPESRHRIGAFGR